MDKLQYPKSRSVCLLFTKMICVFHLGIFYCLASYMTVAEPWYPHDYPLYATDFTGGMVYQIKADGTASVFVTGISSPRCITYGPDHALYVGSEGGEITRVGLDGTTQRYAQVGCNARGLTFDNTGNLYVGMDSCSKVLKISPTGEKTTYVSGFRSQGLAFAANGDLYVATGGAGDSKIMCVNQTGGYYAFTTTQTNPVPLAFDLAGFPEGYLYSSENVGGNISVIKINSSGQIAKRIELGRYPPIWAINGLCVTSDGCIHAGEGPRIHKYDDNLNEINTISGFTYISGITASRERFITTGRLHGIIRDASTKTPIPNATIYVSSQPKLSGISNSQGYYQINGLPFGMIVTLVASDTNYATAWFPGAQVSMSNPIQVFNLELSHVVGTSFRLFELNPNPNPSEMTIMQGGIGYRYYQIVDENGIPRNNVTITTQPNLGGPFRSNTTIRPGIVKIEVPAKNITSGQTITITHVNGIQLSPTDQKSFDVYILPLSQAKVWELRTPVELGISNLVSEMEGGLIITLRDNQNTDSLPEITSIERKALLGAGVSASAKIGAGAKVLDLGGEVTAGIGGSITMGGIARDKFAFAYDTTDFVQNTAKLDLLLYPGIALNPVLQTLQLGLEVSLLPEYREEIEAGFYFKYQGEAKAGLNAKGLLDSVMLGFRTDGELSGKVTGSLTLYQGDRYGLAVETGGEWSVDAEVGRISVKDILFPDPQTKAILPAWHSGGLGSTRFEIVCSGNILEEIRIRLYWENEGTGSPYNVSGEQLDITINGPADSLSKAVNPLGLLDFLIKSRQSSPSESFSLTPRKMINELDYVIQYAQKEANLTINYEHRMVPAKGAEATAFEFDVGADAGLEADVNAGLKCKIRESRELLVERGRMVGISLFPTELYAQENYQSIKTTLTDVYSKAIGDVGTPILQKIFDTAETIVETGKEVVLGVGKAVLQVGSGIVQAGTNLMVSCSKFFGGQSQNLIIPPSNTGSEGTADTIAFFGIGGIYDLEPASLVLSQPGTFSISYLDSDVNSLDESVLAMYRWDETKGRWRYVGGMLNLTTNTVVANIDRLGIYTLGIRNPYGEFIFTTDPNDAPADGASIITFTSEQLMNNDLTVVADDTTFTVTTTGGTILTEDAEPEIEGVQVRVKDGRLVFELQAPLIGMNVRGIAANPTGMATIAGRVVFTDTTPPIAPIGMQFSIVDGKVFLKWNVNNENDIMGYRLYYDDDQSGPPYEGISYLSGSRSPIDVADANSCFLRGLQSGHTYYIALRAYDNSGNLSDYGHELVFVNTLPQDSDSDGLPDNWELQYSNMVNGLNPTADDAQLDNDQDGLTNWNEYISGNNPLDPDTDHDGVRDGLDRCAQTPPGIQVDVRGCTAGDYNQDGLIDLADLATIARYWLSEGCDMSNSWCGSTDFNEDGKVNIDDIVQFIENWLKKS